MLVNRSEVVMSVEILIFPVSIANVSNALCTIKFSLGHWLIFFPFFLSFLREFCEYLNTQYVLLYLFSEIATPCYNCCNLILNKNISII